MSIEAVLFDFDGVIADSFINQFKVMKCICEQTHKEFPYKNPSALKNDYREPFTLMYEKLGFNWERDKELLYRLFLGFQEEHGPKVPLVKGIEPVIESLHVYHQLGIVTQNGKKVVENKLRQFNIDIYFDAIITYEDVARIKPHPDGLIRCLGELGAHADEAVYIGDMPSDVKTAKSAGTYSISYLGGYGTKQKFKELPAEEYSYTKFIKSPKEILRLVHDLD
jgi:HAD superfamily hydrolase (TIGR01509 family)